MKNLGKIVQGPFKDEGSFKAALMKLSKRYKNVTWFEIENEEKEPGMPDILVLRHRGIFALNDATSGLIEVKLSDKNGFIEFQPTQPLFYKRNAEITINILAWDVRHGCVICIDSEEVIRAKSLKLRLDNSKLFNLEVGCES